MITAKLETIDSAEKFERLVNYVNKLKPEYTVIDTETDGLVEKTCKLYGIGLCFNEDYGFYIVWRNQEGKVIWNEEEIIWITYWLVNVSVNSKLIGHNILYDVLVVENNLNIDLSPYIYSDTCLLKHLIDEEQPHGLKPTSLKYLGNWADLAQQEMIESVKANGGSVTKDKFEMYKANTAILAKYCMHDCLLTLKLFNLFDKKLDEEGLRDFFYKEEVMPLYETTINMKRQGFSIDLEHFNSLKEEITKEISKLEKEIMEEIQSYIGKFANDLLNEECPIKRSGSLPKFVAKEIGAPLPEKEGKITLAKKAILEQKKNNPQFAEFYSWVAEGGEAEKMLQKAISAAQKAMFFDKYPEQKYIFNLNSNDHLSYLLCDCMGYQAIDKTPTGKNKIDETFFDSIVSDDPTVQKILDYKKLNKLFSTYIEGILSRQVNGKIHTSMLQTGTTSSRYASRDPNLNNLPAKSSDKGLIGKYTNAIRKGLIAGEGYKIVGADFSSLEPHLAAYVSGDKDLIDIFVSNKDFYSAIGIKQFGTKDANPYKDGSKDSFSVKYPELRDLVKTYSLAAFYGATAPRISQVTGKSIKESEQLLNGYFEAYPDVAKFIKKSHYEAKKFGKVKIASGRIRHLPKAKELYDRFGNDLLDFRWAKTNNLLSERAIFRNLLNNAVNCKIQGLAAHCLNQALIKMTKEFKQLNLDAHVILTVHDEVLVKCKEEITEQISAIVKDCMENCIDIRPIKLKATPIIGDSYGDCK